MRIWVENLLALQGGLQWRDLPIEMHKILLVEGTIRESGPVIAADPHHSPVKLEYSCTRVVLSQRMKRLVVLPFLLSFINHNDPRQRTLH